MNRRGTLNSKSKVTIYDIAQIAKTSPRTVTRAFQKDSPINEETRKRILAIAQTYHYQPNSAASRIRGKELTLGVIMVTQMTMFSDGLIRGFRNAEKQLVDMKTKVLICHCVAESEIESAVKNLTDRSVDGFILVCDTANLKKNIFSELTEKRLPFVTIVWDGLKPAISHISVDTNMKGRIAASLCSMLCPCGNIAVFTGSLHSTHHSTTLEGFRAETEACGLKIVRVYDTNDDPGIAAEAAADLISSGILCDSVFFSSANAVAPIGVFQERRFKPKIVCSDIFPETGAYIREGTVTAAIFQNPEKQGRLAVISLYRYLAENRKTEPFILITPQIVLKSNLSVYEIINIEGELNP